MQCVFDGRSTWDPFVSNATQKVKQLNRSFQNCKHEAHQLVGRQNASKIRRKAVGGGIFHRFFSNFEKHRLEVVDDVISTMPVG